MRLPASSFVWRWRVCNLSERDDTIINIDFGGQISLSSELDAIHIWWHVVPVLILVDVRFTRGTALILLMRAPGAVQLICSGGAERPRAKRSTLTWACAAVRVRHQRWAAV